MIIVLHVDDVEQNETMAEFPIKFVDYLADEKDATRGADNTTPCTVANFDSAEMKEQTPQTKQTSTGKDMASFTGKPAFFSQLAARSRPRGL